MSHTCGHHFKVGLSSKIVQIIILLCVGLAYSIHGAKGNQSKEPTNLQMAVDNILRRNKMEKKFFNPFVAWN